jgi:hypothetical protein
MKISLDSPFKHAKRLKNGKFFSNSAFISFFGVICQEKERVHMHAAVASKRYLSRLARIGGGGVYLA